MSEEAKLAHSKALKGRTHYKGVETFNSVSNRIVLSEFTRDFYNNLTDTELAEKYECTVRVIEIYRRKNKLFNRLREV